ncbi:Cytochrome P450 monooxygenase [Lachnellula willkommii]|uniref:Cytochrome P450 monooxygenase n=1 Tax=Lachnellula willkommii TaxID=215461 RepID=A0A559M2W4_9HELO|nr:Cytochrome P450 monooxygenase [Lachnellula willkommii]
MLGWIRLGFKYSAIGAVFSILQTLVPSFAQKRKQHMKFTKERLQKRLDSDTDRKDIIAYVHCDNDEKDGLSYEEVLGNSRILLTAGSETTATHLSGATWTADEITLRSVNMPGLDAVIQESFRLYPSVPAALPRITDPEGAVIHRREFRSRQGALDLITFYKYFQAYPALPIALGRWLLNAPQKFKNNNKEALQPIHLGPRVCLGKSLAYFEIRSILTRMLWNFDMQLEDESQHWLVGQAERVYVVG